MSASVIRLVRCPSCHAANRASLDRPRPWPELVCTRCQASLPTADHPVTITDANFCVEVEHSPLPVLLDFWAPWCGLCRTLGPVVEQLAIDLAGRLRVAKANVEENLTACSRFWIRRLPTLVLIKGGWEVDRMIEVGPKSEILRRLQTLI